LIVGLLQGCGGGSGDSSAGSPPSSTPANPSSTGPVAPSGQKLSLVALDLKLNDTIVTTAPATTTVGSNSSVLQRLQEFATTAATTLLADAIQLFAKDAVAQQAGYQPLQMSAGFQVSRKLDDGALVGLNPVVKYYETQADGSLVERTITCDLTTAEVRIDQYFVLDAATNDFLVLAQVPDRVSQGCMVTFRPATLVVNSSGATFEITENLSGPLKDVIPANHPMFNSGDAALLIDANDVVRIIEFPAPNSLTLTDLTSESAPVYTRFGFMAFDGKYLLARSNIPGGTVPFFVYEKDRAAFKIFRPTDMNPGETVLLDDKNRLLFLAYAPRGRGFYAADPVTLAVTEAFPGAGECLPGLPIEEIPTCARGLPNQMEAMRGRHGKWLVSMSGVLWNYETFETWCLSGRAVSLTRVRSQPECEGGASYVKMSDSRVFTVDGSKSTYVWHDIDTKASTVVNLDLLGYLVKDFTIFEDVALVEVVNTANSDRKYVEINWATGAVIDRGVISSGGRKVVSVLPLGA
jgi:hypothetical protein